MATEVTDKNFEDLIIKSGKVAMVDIWAPWCGPCRMMTPIVDELFKEYEGKAIISKLNSDENQIVPSTFNVSGIPTILFFKDGKLVDKQVGAVPKQVLVQKLEALLK